MAAGSCDDQLSSMNHNTSSSHCNVNKCNREESLYVAMHVYENIITTSSLGCRTANHLLSNYKDGVMCTDNSFS